MTVQTTTNKVLYTGNGATLVFAYTFKIFLNTDLKVYVNDASGNPVLKTLTTDYTVDGVGADAGGNVTFVVAPANGRTVTILRTLPATQLTAYPSNNKFPAVSHEIALDRLVMLVQQLNEQIGRQPILPVDVTFTLTLPEPSALKFFRWNATATALELVNVATLGSYVDPITTKGDLLVGGPTGAGTRLDVGADFTLPEAASAATVGIQWSTLATVLGRILTTQGDILTRDGSGVVRKARGARGSIFTFTATDPSFLAFATKGNLLSSDGTDATVVGAGADGKALVARAGATSGLEYANQGLAQSFHGLHIGTHPDNDVAKSKIALKGLKSVVMSDGTRYDDVVVPGVDAPLVADITQSGGGGLDTGAEGASIGYEVHLIGKSSTKAKSDLKLLLHRTKDYFNDVTPSTSIAATTGLRDISARTQMAQEIAAVTAGKVEFIDVYISRQGSPTGNMWLELYNDSAGLPGSSLAVSDKFDVSKLSASNVPVRFVFRSPATVVASTVYHVVYKGDFAISAVNFVNLNTPASDAYASHDREKFDGATWTSDSVNDLSLKLYVTRNDTALTFPSGYDQSCKLVPWVFNNSGSDFDPIKYLDRRAFNLAAKNSGTISTTAPTLIDVSAVYPPIPIRVFASLANNAAGNSSGSLGGIPEGFAVGTSIFNPDLYEVTLTALTANDLRVQSVFLPVQTEFQGLYFATNATSAQVNFRGWEW